jgi:hypothetical protein
MKEFPSLKYIQSTPLVLGTSLPPVFSMACRIASASALKADSDLWTFRHEVIFRSHDPTDRWWSFSPRKTSTCKVTPDAMAKE